MSSEDRINFVMNFALYVENEFNNGLEYVENTQTSYGSNPTIGDIDKEDHWDYWEDIKIYLENIGYKVIANNNPREGIKVYKNKKEVK